jgi:hypothetical protein
MRLKRITARQQAVLDFVVSQIGDKGFPPTRAEICEHFGFKSANAAETYLVILRDRGYITLIKDIARGILVSPEQMTAFRMRHALAMPGSTAFALVADTDDLPGRLAFLRMLKEKTVYADHATLGLIIQDYERTFRLRRAVEQSVENEDRRGRTMRPQQRNQISRFQKVG